ncbi:unnamed protein product [Leptosia nina]|uniref:THAP-type domain-containing protein n=1 Tax=Leptosia nina TaxID=320188 RepID=A0AAV1JPG5_9NEOP
MGGCKCSYRNCTVKSDGKTHLFHYPVFDKQRCHQWIKNAQRHEFLNLKVSQLKNRVICQYHFKDEHFMNYKKEKLIFDAVPTEDGPYCDSEKWRKSCQNSANILPVTIEDIENEQLTHIEKKANYSLKYADFLTCSEIDLSQDSSLDMKCFNEKNISSSIKRFRQSLKNEPNSPKTALAVVNPFDTSNIETEENINLQQIETNINLCEDAEAEPKWARPANKIKSTINSNKEEQNEPKAIKEYGKSSKKENMCRMPNTSSLQIRPESKVNIISQKKIKSPIPMPKNLHPVSPMIVLKVPEKEPKSLQHLHIQNNVDTVDLINPINLNEQHQNIAECATNETQQANTTQQNTYSVDLTQPNQPLFSIDLPEQQVYPQSVTYSVDLIKQNHEPILKCNDKSGDKPLYIIDVNGIKRINQANWEGSNNNSQRNESFIDLRNIKMAQDKPAISILSTDQAKKTGCNIKELQNKYKEDVEYEAMQDRKIESQPSPTQKKENSQRVIMLKNKLNPNRVAAIEEKRQFNKKLRDAVEKCLNQAFDPGLQTKKLPVSPEPDRQKSLSTNVSTHLSSDPNLPSAQEYTLNFLESRLQQMENRLLNKIDQNSQKIREMKEDLAPKKKPKSSTASMQTGENHNTEEAYKRHLFGEISQFLSPSCNSAVYEELFINKYSLNNKYEDIEIVKRKRKCNR